MSARLVALATALGLLACFAYVWPFSVDDSYILAQYARRLAAGQGYTFRAGAPSDGVTGPLWLPPLVLAARMGVDPAIVSKLLGGACALAAAWLLVDTLARRSLFRRSALAAVPFVLSSVPFAIWAVAGLETAGAGLLALLLARAALARPRPQIALAALASAGVAWIRPELVPFALTLVSYVVFRAGRKGLLALLGLALGLLAVAAFRIALFGDPWPMVAHAKPPVLGFGANYVFVTVARASGLWLLLVFAWGLGRAHAREWVLTAALAVHALAVLLAGGDWMPGMRLFAPVVPVAALALGPMLARRSLDAPRKVLVGGLLLFALRSVEMAEELHGAREGGTELARTARELSLALRGVDGPVVALDVGALAYWSGAQVVDLGGLTEPRVAHAPGGHLDKRVDSAWLEQLAPARIVLHSRERPKVDEHGRVRWFAGYPVEQHVLAMPWVLRGYRVERVIEHASNYFYVVLARRDAPFS
jgi:hypothetical protein